MNAADLSPADWEALAYLRLGQMIRIDEAGRHAESLARLAKAELIECPAMGTNMPWTEVTEAQKALGFTDRGGTGIGGVVYASAPHWRWVAFGGDDAANLLRTHECRSGCDINWDDFLAWFEARFEADVVTTVAAVAEHYGHSILDTVDWIDARYWAGRGGPGPIETHVVEVEGE